MDTKEMLEAKEVMHKLFNKGLQVQRKIERLERRLKKFGIKRFIFFKRFSNIKQKLKDLQDSRLALVAVSLAISRKLNAMRRKQRAKGIR